MGVVVRADSKFFWMNLEIPNQRPIRESTKIRIDRSSPHALKKSRALAEAIYARRMRDVELAIVSGRLPRRQSTRTRRRLGPGQWSKARDYGLVYVYFVECEGLIKIGCTVNMERRMASLQTSQAKDLRLLAMAVGDNYGERLLHQQFREARQRGEWFEKTPALMRLIEAIAAAPGVPLPMVQATLQTRGGKESQQVTEP